MDKKVLISIITVTFLVLGLGVYFVTRPTPLILAEEMLPETSAVKGNPDAKIKVVEFSDFQCPACKAYKPIVDEIVNKYGDQLIFGYRHFPLPQHPFGYKAAVAAEAAAEQGKFWEMYTYLFDKQEVLSDIVIEEAGKGIGLDADKYKQDLASGMINQRVQMDLSDGTRLKVNSTPTFFLNGKKLNIRSPQDLEKAIVSEL
jgi:protein-disulfide isomerase